MGAYKKYSIFVMAVFVTNGIANQLSVQLHSLHNALEQIYDSLPKEGKPQPMPIASRWQLVAEEKESRTSLKELFLQDVERDKRYNQHIPPKSKAILRIVTFNVNNWYNLSLESNKERIKEIIKHLNPDLIALQEASGVSEEIELFDNYMLLASCIEKSLDGSWEGNLILGRNSSEFTSSQGLGKVFKNQLKRPINNPCYSFVTIELKKINKSFTLYSTQLSENMRRQPSATNIRTAQIEELIEDINISKLNKRNALIAADFNATREKNYQGSTVENQSLLTLVKQSLEGLDLQTIQALMGEGYESSFEKIEWPLPTYTVWSGIAMDYIFITPKWNIPIAGSYIYYTDASDHLPVVLDLDLTA